MLRRPLILSCTAAATLALVPAAHAAAPWGAPQTLTDSRMEIASSPAVVAGGSGDVLVPFGVLIGGSPLINVAISHRPAGEADFAQPAITTTRSSAARVLPYAASRVIVVSQGSGNPSRLRVRFGSTSGALGAVRDLAPGENVLRYSAAANVRGDAVVAFVAQRPAQRPSGSQRRIVMVARRSAGHAFSKAETIVGRGEVNSVATAIDAAGDIVVAYDQQGRVQTRSRPAGHGWQPIDEVDPHGVKGEQLRVAVGPGGRAVLGIFEQELTEGGDNGPGSVLASLREAGHHFHTPQLLERFADRFPDGSHPDATEVALDDDGALLAWTGRVAGGWGVRVATLSGTRFGDLRDASPAGEQLDGLAAGDGGRATVAWSQVFADPPPASATIGAAVRAPGAAEFGPPELVSGVEASTGPAAVAYAPSDGAPTIAWLARPATGPSVVRAATRATP